VTIGIMARDVNALLASARTGRYVNNFLGRGRVQKLCAQGRADARRNRQDIGRWRMRNWPADFAHRQDRWRREGHAVKNQ
jgi:multidrug efflux pump subunit AcrB